ncbi:MAG: YrdB family protein [Streptosporangiaceae bacterium]
MPATKDADRRSAVASARPRGARRAAAAATAAVRFLVELGAYASLAYWGQWAGSTGPERVGLAVLAPLAAILVWSRYLAPRAPRRLGDPAALVSELVIFAIASVALAVSSTAGLAAVLAVIAALNAVLVRVLHPPGSAPDAARQHGDRR